MTARIVLLSNDSALLRVLHDLSASAGYRPLRCRPLEVTDVHAVVKRAEADLVILDRWITRDEDSGAFLRHLWTDRDTTHIPVIVVTEKTDTPPSGGILRQTMHYQVVAKPLDAHMLLRTIAAALDPAVTHDARRISPQVTVSGGSTTAPFLVAAGGAAQ